MSIPSAQAAVLGLDPARSSGWALWLPSTIASSGVCTSAQDRRAIVVDAKVQAAARGLPLVVVYEQHTVGGGAGRDGKGTRWTPAVMMGLGESRGRWLEQLELAGVPRSHCIGVTPATWRRATLPRCGRDRAALKAAALLSCKARGWGVESDDEAEACLIAYWGAVGSAEVAALARRRAA